MVALAIRLWSGGLAPWHVAVYLILAAGVLSVPVLLRRGLSQPAATSVLVCSTAGLIAATALGHGGLEAPYLTLLPLLPLLAFLLGDRTSWLSAAWIAGLMAGLVLVEWRPSGVLGPDSPPAGWSQALWLGVAAFLVATMTWFHERRSQRAGRALEVQATKDHLTGLANRREFEEQLDLECRRAARDGSSVAVILLDVDHFKGFNDEYGHPHGDRCLVAVSYAISTCARRAGDLLARFGGEEFIALVPGAAEGEALEIAESMRLAVREMDIPHTRAATGIVTVSLGAASARGSELIPDVLIQRADEALYRAKQAGRDRVEAASAVAPA